MTETELAGSPLLMYGVTKPIPPLKQRRNESYQFCIDASCAASQTVRDCHHAPDVVCDASIPACAADARALHHAPLLCSGGNSPRLLEEPVEVSPLRKHIRPSHWHARQQALLRLERGMSMHRLAARQARGMKAGLMRGQGVRRAHICHRHGGAWDGGELRLEKL